ncbi:efflux RND transporter permease subunit [Desulfuromonas sp. TF]|uniref:efflux RND transporter permease subunit n=1 Tax=Desulfuromonas sp. TF TaxID=1232410 RepID=UPI0003FC89FE|nr:efflux RND transporter permease subunit [Desulfuromonas sp. TF]
MKGAVQWMTRNHVAANLLMLVLVLGGLLNGPSIKQEVFPEVTLDRIQVQVAYPGAGPEEVEEGILLKVEENLTGVDGIKEIKSLAAEGMGIVTAEIYAGEDADRVLQDIKSEVDRIITFPEDAEKPVISKLLNRQEVISVVVYGEVSERSLREQAEAIRDELLELPDITQVDLGGVRPYEISIEIREENLRRYNLTLEQVAQRIRRASLDLPGGTIKTEGGQILLRTMERRYWGPGYADIVVLTAEDGTQVRLGDIAEVRDDFRDTDEFARFDGQPAAMVKVFRIGEQKPIEISETVNRFVAEKRAGLPPSLHLSTWNDSSEIFASRMNLLKKNALLGLTLVVIILGLFLEIRLALWVMLGIPISFFGTLLLMPALGVSINMISLFAFILSLGILVDDAIVVGENIYEQRQKGKPYLRAAIDGALEVAIPVTFSILTTVAAFLPLVFVTGMMGKFIKVIPLIVITLLLVSLVESLFVLPAHLAIGRPMQAPGGLIGAIDRNRRRFGAGLDRFVAGPYRRALDLNLRWRYASLACGVAMLLLAVGLVRGGIIKFHFMPEVDGDVIITSLQMPRGTPAEETGRVQQYIVDEAMATVAEFDRARPEEESVLRNVYAVTGATLMGGGPMGWAPESGSHLADIALFLTEAEERGIPTAEISRRWRENVGELPGIESLTFTANLMRMGANIDIQLAHEDFGVLDRASEQIRAALAEYPGVGDIQDTYARGKREIKLRLTPEARTLGITEEELGRQVRSAFYGAEALRLQRGRNEVKVMVRYPEDDRRHLHDFETMRIRTPDGGEIPLQRAAFIEEGFGFSEINRTDRKRVINVTASVDSKQANAGEILTELRGGLLVELAHDFPGLAFNLEGEEKERRESMASMLKGFQLALVAIFALLAIAFRSYSQPVLIMAAIPFGIIGAILGHMIMGFSLSLLSLFGIVALAGVVVNDSLLLITRTNEERRDGKDSHLALLDAATRRFRPILLTSLTTFFGLMPMILETSVQAQFLIPMAISLAFGILFATGITLLLIPAFYLILEDIRALFGLRGGHADHTPEAEKG